MLDIVRGFTDDGSWIVISHSEDHSYYRLRHRNTGIQIFLKESSHARKVKAVLKYYTKTSVRFVTQSFLFPHGQFRKLFFDPLVEAVKKHNAHA